MLVALPGSPTDPGPHTAGEDRGTRGGAAAPKREGGISIADRLKSDGYEPGHRWG